MLFRSTLPFALRLPKICEGVELLMRFSVTALEFGWLKFVVSLGAMLNERQSMTALWLVWLIWYPDNKIPKGTRTKRRRGQCHVVAKWC